MCKFTVELALCPCTQGRSSKRSETQCVRFRKPTEKNLVLGGTRHALDVEDGMGLSLVTACPLEKSKNGSNADANMLCPNTDWALQKDWATSALIRAVPCKDSLAGCRWAWGESV